MGSRGSPCPGHPRRRHRTGRDGTPWRWRAAARPRPGLRPRVGPVLPAAGERAVCRHRPRRAGAGRRRALLRHAGRPGRGAVPGPRHRHRAAPGALARPGRERQVAGAVAAAPWAERPCPAVVSLAGVPSASPYAWLLADTWPGPPPVVVVCHTEGPRSSGSTTTATTAGSARGTAASGSSSTAANDGCARPAGCARCWSRRTTTRAWPRWSAATGRAGGTAAAPFGPGSLLGALAVRDAAARAQRWLDLGPGPLEYKHRLATGVETLRWTGLVARGPPTRGRGCGCSRRAPTTRRGGCCPCRSTGPCAVRFAGPASPGDPDDGALRGRDGVI